MCLAQLRPAAHLISPDAISTNTSSCLLTLICSDADVCGQKYSRQRRPPFSSGPLHLAQFLPSSYTSRELLLCSRFKLAVQHQTKDLLYVVQHMERCGKDSASLQPRLKPKHMQLVPRAACPAEGSLSRQFCSPASRSGSSSLMPGWRCSRATSQEMKRSPVSAEDIYGRFSISIYKIALSLVHCTPLRTVSRTVCYSFRH